MRLMLVGYWAGPHAGADLPLVDRMIDTGWDADERDEVAAYVANGTVARGYMGFAECRVCGQPNGNLEFTDGTYVWPEVLAHYVAQHGVRLPQEFVSHVARSVERIEGADREDSWWKSQTLGGV